MAYADPAVQRRKDRERFARRTAERVKAAGLCPRCGDRPPAPGGRSARLAPKCAIGRAAPATPGCARRENRAAIPPRRANTSASGRARSGPSASPRAFARGAARPRRRTAARPASRAWRSGALRTGRNTPPVRPPASNTAAPTRTPRGAPAGPRASGARKSASRPGSASAAASTLPSRGEPPAGPAARSARRRKRLYAERRAAGCCTRCGGPVHDGLTRCRPCAIVEDAGRNPERKNEQSRKRYRIRRELGLCTSCGAPSQGASRCAPCAERSYRNSGHFKGMPAWPPSYAVFLRDTDVCLGSFDDEMEVAAFVAFEKLDRERIEIVRDANPLAAMAAWE